MEGNGARQIAVYRLTFYYSRDIGISNLWNNVKSYLNNDKKKSDLCLLLPNFDPMQFLDNACVSALCFILFI